MALCATCQARGAAETKRLRPEDSLPCRVGRRDASPAETRARPENQCDSATCSKNAAAKENKNLNSRFFFFKAGPQHYAICSAKNALFYGSPSQSHQPGGSRFLRAKCFDITRRAVDAIAQHQPALIRCDALSTASHHHYLYKCRVLAAQKKWRERTQRRRKRLARTGTSRRIVGGIRRAGADDL